MISPIGLNLSSMWQALISGTSGMDYITLFDPEPFDTKFAAEVKGFDPLNYVDRKQARHMDRFVQFAMAASLEAVEQAGLRINNNVADDVGVLIGSGIGGLATLSHAVELLRDKGPRRLNPFVAPMLVADMASGEVSIALGAKGPNFCATSACASSSDAIGVAYETIKRGDARAMIAGGSEAAITPIGIGAFNAAHAISTRNDEPQKASRPFDAQRDGFVMGEGSAILVLEELDMALSRGAPILAEVIGYGASGDAYHITQPSENGEGGARAMQMALRKAGIEKGELDYINAHGTSTILNDKSETLAIKSVFGAGAYRIPISSTKSMVGHLLGAAGAIEAVICILTIKKGVIPPTINLTHSDQECDLDYVPNLARPAKVRSAMSNSFGFGGHNSVLVFREYNEG